MLLQPETEVQRPKLPNRFDFFMAFLWGIVFTIVYFLFNVLWGQTIGSKIELLFKVEWSDLSLGIVILLHISIVGLFFFFYGVFFYEKAFGWLQQLIMVLPVVLLGGLIWGLTYRSVSGAGSNLNEMPWLFFTLFAFWLTPVTEYLAIYIKDSSMVKFAGLALSIVPSAAAWLGMRLMSWSPRKNGLRPMLYASLVPLLLSVMLGGSFMLPKSAPFTLMTFPSIDGATAAIPFGKILVHELTGVNQSKAAKSVQFNTTHNAYVNLIEKRADLIFVAGPSEEEVSLATSKGIKLKQTPIGKDAFIFLVHRSNPVSQITAAQLQQIYSGNITNWKEVGGYDNEIVAYQREKNSGSQTFMEQKIMKGLPLTIPPKERRTQSMGGLIEVVADYHNAANALGYSFYYYASEMNKREEVKFLAVDGTEPNKENIRSEKYPFTAVLYAVTRADEPASSPANRVLSWIVSTEGSKAVSDGGYVPIVQ